MKFTLEGIATEIEKLREKYSVEGDFEARRRAFDLQAIEIEMRRRGLTEVDYLGPLMAHRFEQGEMAILAPGAVVKSTNPSDRSKTNRFARRIKVHGFDPGYIKNASVVVHHGAPAEIEEARVTWVGSGSYYYWTDAANLRPVPAPKEEMVADHQMEAPRPAM